MIRKVAVIGGGPAGLTTVYNFLKVNKDSDLAVQCVGFEAKSKLGGVWSDTPGSNLDTHPMIFEKLGSLRDERTAADSRALFYEGTPLAGIDGGEVNLSGLSGSSSSKPVKLARKSGLTRDGIYFSDKTGLYDDFMSNVPEDLMRYEDDINDYGQNACARNDRIAPLTDLPSIKYHLDNFISKNDLEENYRMNTSVEYVDKTGASKWMVVAKRSVPENDYDEWYIEYFDAVVVASGHFQIPYIPFFMSKPEGRGAAETAIHRFNQKYPGTLVHVKDIDIWYHKVLPSFEKTSRYRRIIIVGKSFSCMDVLKRIIHLKKSMSLEIFISTDVPPMPENTANPFYWFDEWLAETQQVVVKPQITEFVSQTTPTLRFADGSELGGVDCVIFATGYLYGFPFLSSRLLDECRISITPDPRNTDNQPSNISRVSGLYLHTFSIADPTLTFPGVSSNANFQSFHISAKAIVGAYHRFNTLSQQQNPTDAPYYDSIWRQILPSLDDQLVWSKKRLAKTGNTGAYHFYYPLPLLIEGWEKPCEAVFPFGQDAKNLFPPNAPQLSTDGIAKLRDIFLEVMEQ
ncbi:hypothetical protein HG536_0G02510 [Torulaspora globosa]|uniref:FAD/NAD(P)-binding domain-containing protein n=1 Tax=Torulaspora globosa TaxID=48254 RepID=A0A7G3ZLK4_9SACH|nr:uncharacterized protein HG536_0G02510 [Torulaspora globosa]QLL34390.1 hypothetical protein HG536_0G02510 [Torulaspora globosa]